MSISLKDIYTRQAEKLHPDRTINSGFVKWMAPSNIALVKYWGKKADQLPANPSVSLTLKHAYTITRVVYSNADKVVDNLIFRFDGQNKPEFKVKVQQYINKISHYLPFIKKLRLEIETSNSFPHSTGIASSASAMAALSLCFCSIEKILFGTLETEHEFYRKASFLARLGSGSASRSVYGGFALWGETALLADSSDLTAIPVQNVHPDFSEMRDTILVVSAVPKSISSSVGHKLMNDHPYAESRYNQALSNLSGMLSVLKNGDIENFIRITENEALSLHAMMMTSRENYLLFLPNTLEIIRKIRYFRETQKIPVCFTLDAGANVHMLYPGKYSGETTAYIQNELITYCENNRFIHDGEGTGPEYLNE